jgi:hypothetical protein
LHGWDRERTAMRFLMLRSGAPAPEGRPNRAFDEAMRAYHDDLRAAGVLLAAEGLEPSRSGARLRFDGSGTPISLEGPFDRPSEDIDGFYILQLRSWADAIEWARRCPVDVALMDGKRAEIDIRAIDDGPHW